MIDYARLCDAICARLGSAGAEATASTGAALLHAMGAAAAELRRQRDAAQESGEEGREGASWAATTNGADSSHAAASDQRALSPASIHPQACADCAEREANARRERDRLANALAVCGVVARGGRQAYPPEHGSDTLKAIEVLLAERDEAKQELAVFAPLLDAERERREVAERERDAAKDALIDALRELQTAKAERERATALRVDADTLDAIEAVNDRTCPQCRTHIISVAVEPDAARGRNRIVWTCSNGCQALEGEGPFKWTDFLDEELDTLHRALMAERASKRAEAEAILAANSPEECARLRAALAAADRRESTLRDTAEHFRRLMYERQRDCEAVTRERDEARARLAELEPLVAAVFKQYDGWTFSETADRINDSLSALVLHERRRAKEQADGE